MEAAISHEIGAARAAGKRTAYCRQQAAECALAATTAILGEVRQAYLNIEQAWLQLAPDINSYSKKAARPSTATECEEVCETNKRFVPIADEWRAAPRRQI
jgi:hypothetical protein